MIVAQRLSTTPRKAGCVAAWERNLQEMTKHAVRFVCFRHVYLFLWFSARRGGLLHTINPLLSTLSSMANLLPKRPPAILGSPNDMAPSTMVLSCRVALIKPSISPKHARKKKHQQIALSSHLAAHLCHPENTWVRQSGEHPTSHVHRPP
jgi:hypothetical protein